VRPLRLSTSGALAQVIDVLEGLASHLPMPLARMRHLLLGRGTQNRLPDVIEEGGDVEAQTGECNRERREESGREVSRVESCPAGGAQDSRGGQPREERSTDGSHFDDLPTTQ
jgi:hypothetical protein